MIKWVLGSGSPRRKELLAGIGVSFEIRTKDTPEDFPSTMSLTEVPTFLAKQKALALLPELSDDEMVICADTVVILNNQILGKPESVEAASDMLQQLSNQTHEVITGVFIGNKKKQRIFSDRTLVTFKTLSLSEIEFYIQQYKPFDKAGSYGVQEWIGYIAIERLEGTYTNVMGLPTNLVYQYIQEFEAYS